MKGTDALAAIETAEYFLDSYNYALQSGDTSAMRSVTDAKCAVCTEIADDIAMSAGRGEWQEAGLLNYGESVVPSGYERLAELPVQFDVTQSPGYVRDSSGRETDSWGESQKVMQLLMASTNGRWLLSDILDVTPQP